MVGSIFVDNYDLHLRVRDPKVVRALVPQHKRFRHGQLFRPFDNQTSEQFRILLVHLVGHLREREVVERLAVAVTMSRTRWTCTSEIAPMRAPVLTSS